MTDSRGCGLCPNNRITGGKVFSTRTRKVHNRVALALRIGAQTRLKSQTALGAYYRRMRARQMGYELLDLDTGEMVS